ncbi:DNA-binding transcriptional regulator, ArsR family [Kosakonia oryzendophytica]|uniref:DNA-binding transcriptional regulator, ArsR family n=1 Tax=Kosakonia oryzendophytica TaxID=1005665 RepID=A0A1C4CJP3_9ENTR|nr:winged helix-turn-helix domain-containing protein [Kosakonia oryzendophytica]AMO47478.1 ArsR family transcriptional regulator [Enterobacter sp. FY-07]TDT57065.1 DNA-binding transcriptional ArsR family regulator [Enterobacter sp. AG5470]WBT59198.1 winged helix-turn-helix domain-containing protein [Kosakonia oryzendophytica]SCC19380.1 DNA-binding transcriptional regulator, ArsR family [Kosakonia oryzendophytica]
MSLPGLQHSHESGTALEEALAGIASAMSDPSRARMLCALMDGRAWTATELSSVADISASTASAHLNRLLSHGLLVCVSQGRHRYYRLAGSDVAGLLENMMGVSMRGGRALATRTPVELRRARTCYDHLAGEIAVDIYEFMQREGWVTDEGSAVTEPGKRKLEALGVTLDPRTRRKPCCACLDWSERRFHLGGDAGASLLIAFEHKGWLRRTPGYREVTVTDEGKSALFRVFGVGA